MVAMKEPRTYGEWGIPVPELRADRIQGAQLRYGPDDKPASIALQFLSPKQGWYTLEFSFLDGMFFLSLLKSIQLDTEFPFPDDPRTEKL
jgi:hypothetical protein